MECKWNIGYKMTTADILVFIQKRVFFKAQAL